MKPDRFAIGNALGRRSRVKTVAAQPRVLRLIEVRDVADRLHAGDRFFDCGLADCASQIWRKPRLSCLFRWVGQSYNFIRSNLTLTA